MATKTIATFFSVNANPVVGLSPTITILEMDASNVNANTIVVNGDILTDTGTGWYRYDFTSYDFSKSYAITVDGGNTLPRRERLKVSVNESFAEDVTTVLLNSPGTLWMTPGSIGELINTSSANTNSTVISISSLTTLLDTLLKFEKNRTKIDPALATLTVFDDDGVTPLQVFKLKDGSGNPSVAEVCERDPI